MLGTMLIGTTTSVPSLFTGNVVSSKATRPLLHIHTPSGLQDIGCKNANGWELNFDIAIMTNEAYSNTTSYGIADGVLELLHRAPLSITSHTHLWTECVGISPALTDKTLSGIVLSFNIAYLN